MRQQQKNEIDIDLFVQNSVFKYKKYEQTIFVPVYPRAYIEEVIGIDYDRRTVTAHFVIHITVCCKVNDPALKNFIRKHLILEFGYNQTIYIPQIMKQDNPFCIINEVVQSGNLQDYVTYKISGNLQCSAHFDLMLFPFRQIEVLNHLVIRSQQFREYQIKYNAMMLKNDNILEFNQFSPHITFPEFAGYRIMHFSTEMSTDESKYQMKTSHSRDEILGYLRNFVNNQKKKISKPQQISPEQLVQNLFFMHVQEQEHQPSLEQSLQDWQELSPFKHVLFKFEMMSLKPAFVFQNEVPIWVLAVLSLYTFTSHPDIGNRYGNIVLLIVSYVGLFINFRVNNVGHSSFTFYEIKLIVIMVVPILLIISTVLDYYSNTDQTQTDYALRKSQIQNPFMLASMIIVLLCFFTTVFFLIFTAFSKYFQFWLTAKPTKANRNQLQSLWQNLLQLQWKHPKLFTKMSGIARNKKASVFESQDQQMKKAIHSIITKSGKRMIQPFMKYTDSSKIPQKPSKKN